MAAYELLRNGAQLVQNLEGKAQCVLQGSDWETAWLLIGLDDLLSRKDFAGSRQEMAVVAGCVRAVRDLQEEGHRQSGSFRQRQGRKSGGRGRTEEVSATHCMPGAEGKKVVHPMLAFENSSFSCYVSWFEGAQVFC